MLRFACDALSLTSSPFWMYNTPMPEPEKNRTILRQLLRASTVGLNMVAFTAAGLAIGWFLDNLLGTRFLKVVFLVIGIIGGFRELFKLARKG